MATKNKNTTTSNEKLDLHVGDQGFVVNTFGKDKVPAIIVGFSPDGNPCAWMPNSSIGGGVSGYEPGIHTDWLRKVKGDGGTCWFLDKDRNQFEQEVCLGVKVGDEVFIGRTKSGALIKDGTKEWDTTGRYPPTKATVIGFERDENDKAIKPLLAIDRCQFKVRNIRSDQARYTYHMDDDMSMRFRKKYGDDADEDAVDNIYDYGFVYVNNERAFKTTSTDTKQGEMNMSKETTERPAFLDIIKGDAKDAGYRIAATQISKGTKAGIMAILTKQGGSSSALKAMEEMLDTAYGEALISFALGLGTHYAPIPQLQDPRVQKISEEFRIQAMSGAGNEIMSTVMEMLLPVIMGALASLPAEATAEKARVADHNEEIEEELAVPAQKTMTV